MISGGNNDDGVLANSACSNSRLSGGGVLESDASFPKRDRQGVIVIKSKDFLTLFSARP